MSDTELHKTKIGIQFLDGVRTGVQEIVTELKRLNGNLEAIVAALVALGGERRS